MAFTLVIWTFTQVLALGRMPAISSRLHWYVFLFSFFFFGETLNPLKSVGCLWNTWECSHAGLKLQYQTPPSPSPPRPSHVDSLPPSFPSSLFLLLFTSHDRYLVPFKRSRMLFCLIVHTSAHMHTLFLFQRTTICSSR